MAPHEQEEERHDCQAEIVVCRIAHDPGERPTLELGRSERLHADLAEEAPAAVGHLEAVAVD